MRPSRSMRFSLTTPRDLHMQKLMTALGAALMLAAQALLPSDAAAAETLRFLGRTDLVKYEGDFDHFAADVKGNRLFLAGEDGGTLEVFDLRSGAHTRTVKGMDTPHAIWFDAQRNRLVVSNSGDSRSKVLDGKTYAVVGALDVPAGADVLTHDPSTRTLWVVTGGKNATAKQPDTTVAQVDAASGRVLGTVKFDTDFTEGIAVEQRGHRAFVNLAGKSQVAVLDKA